MRVGVSLSSSHAGADPRDAARWMIERAAAAHAAGLDHLGIGDHHAQRRLYVQNVPMLGRLLAEWQGRPAGCLFLLPLWHPVLMAEQIGTLAAIHDGRFIVQTGIGGGEQQFAAMGRSLRHRASDMDEAFRIVDALLNGETVSSDRFDIRDASIAPVPSEPVEWWIGANADAALDRAARLSGTWYAGPGLTPQVARERAGRFQEACARHGRSSPRMVIRQDAVVAATDAEAEALAAPVLAAGYRGIERAALAIGSPDTVAAHFARYRDAGFTDVSVRQMSIEQGPALESLGLLGHVRATLLN